MFSRGIERDQRHGIHLKIRPKFCCITNLAKENLLKVNNTELIQDLKFVHH